MERPSRRPIVHVRHYRAIGGREIPVGAFDGLLYGSSTNGAYVAAADVSGDGKANLITGAGSGSDTPLQGFPRFPHAGGRRAKEIRGMLG